MLKSLYPQIDWESIKVVGFDLDGTLYDEFEFIAEVYKPISEVLAKYCLGKSSIIYFSILERWLEKGSSYNKIFQEVLEKSNVIERELNLAIVECLTIFRNYKPDISLSKRVVFFLNYITKKYELFLITDGSHILQNAKLKALSLERWFLPENTAISGTFGTDHYKPSIASTNKINILSNITDPKTVVYFGDREIDKEFANNAGFQFVYAKLLLI